MCGLAAYAGKDKAGPFLAEALRRLEYRGYDSWGVALSGPGGTTCVKDAGLPPEAALRLIATRDERAGVAHTRWATHGAATRENAHPVAGGPPGAPEVYLAHNGVLANAGELRRRQRAWGQQYRTDTDTEVLAHELASRLLCHHYPHTVPAAAREALALLRDARGDLAFAAAAARSPGVVVAAARGLPLLVTEAGHLASDPSALAGFAGRAHRLRDGEVVVLTPDGVFLYGPDGRPAEYDLRPVPGRKETLLPAGEAHHTLAEMREQPALFRKPSLVNGREVGPGDFSGSRRPARAVFFGSGSSYHAALLGRLYAERVAGVPAEAHRSGDLPGTPGGLYAPGTAFYALTQSGETHDTLEAMRKVRDAGPHRLRALVAVTNGPGSAACGLADDGACVELDAGPERGVAATKTFTATCLVLLQEALYWAGGKRSFSLYEKARKELPDACEEVLGDALAATHAAVKLNQAGALVLGSGLLYPVALEGALKLKELACLHAEGVEAGELKHGTLALVPQLPCLFLCGEDLDRELAAMSEVKARGGAVLALCDRGAYPRVAELADLALPLPAVDPLLRPVLQAVALQKIACELGAARGCPIDRPRGLAKCVTVP